MKLIVLNLPRALTEGELAEMFRPYGAVAVCDLVIDKATGASKGFGFVEMENTAEANAAIAGLNGTKIGKEKIRVKVSTSAG